MFMMMDYITIVGYTLAVFGAGVTVGKLVEKIERLDRKTEDKDKHIRKNDRRQYPGKIRTEVVFDF